MSTYYEFFAGGGMARAGLGDEWHCLLANDICEKKAKAYADNWGADHLIVADVYSLQSSDLPGHADLAWASFPCQDLSLAGNKAGLKGERSGTFWGFWELVKGLSKHGRKPRMVMLENVYGALTSHDGKDFEAIAKALVNEGYVFGAMVIDAVHFVPQSRPRLFILAADKDMAIPGKLISAVPNPAWHPSSLIKAYNSLSAKTKKGWVWWNPSVPDAMQKTLDDVVETKPTGVKWHTAEETKRLLSMMSSVNRQKVIAAQSSGRLSVGTIYKRTRQGIQRAEVRFDGISGCLRTPSGGSSRQIIIVVDGAKIKTRLLSPREAARLMGLPDEYRLPLKYNDAYHLAGDGVVAPVVRHLAQHLLNPVLSTQQAGELDKVA